MFKHLAKTRRPGKKIASWLAKAKEHKTHGRPITISKAKEKGLKVTALEEDQEFQEHLLSTFHASMVTFGITNCVKMVENHKGCGLFFQIDITKKIDDFTVQPTAST